MKLWLDAQLSPLLALWMSEQGWNVEAVAVRDVGLRDATDPVIFQAARDSGVIVMTKDRDFIRLLDQQGPPPQVIWLRVGNCGNAAIRQVLSATFLRAMELLERGESWVEIRANPSTES